MYVSMSMLATQEGCSTATIRRIVKEMKDSGNYPTAIRRAGKTLIDADSFEHYVRRRERKNEKKI
ncbi:MAG: hypothetical protein IKU36_08460 [Bacteroidales bacterium]|nr:hypothetical protein [Bacteroidales bacterium]